MKESGKKLKSRVVGPKPRIKRGKAKVIGHAGKTRESKLHDKKREARLSVKPIEGISYNYEIPGSETFVLDEFAPKDFLKVLIGVPAIQDPTWFFVLSMNSIAYPPNYTKTTQICWGREIGEARNHIVRQALKSNVQYILFLDDDVMVPPDIFLKLRNHDTDIASALYCTKSNPAYPLIFESEGDGCFEDWKLGDIIKTWGCGLGATLINTDIFRSGKIKEPWFKTTKLEAINDPDGSGWHWRSGTEDLYFYTKVMDAGYDLIVDTSVQCDHYDRLSKIRYPLEGFKQWYTSKQWKT
jgi:hypothetical protein